VNPETISSVVTLRQSEHDIEYEVHTVSRRPFFLKVCDGAGPGGRSFRYEITGDVELRGVEQTEPAAFRAGLDRIRLLERTLPKRRPMKAG
jgi:hypothetical protein